MHHKLFHQESLPNTACTALWHALHLYLRQVQVSGIQGGLVGLLLRSVRVFEQIVWLEVDSGKAALSHPAYQYPAESMRSITPAVVRLLDDPWE